MQAQKKYLLLTVILIISFTLISSCNSSDSNHYSSTYTLYPIDLAFNPIGTRAYRTGYSADMIYVLDAETNSPTFFPNTTTSLADISVGDGPTSLAFGVDGTSSESLLYVANHLGDTVSILNTTSLAVTTVIVGTEPFFIAVAPDGNAAWVANNGSDSVSVISTADNSVASITVGEAPVKLAISSDSQTVYCVNMDSDTISVIDNTSQSVTATITVGTDTVTDAPVYIVLSPDNTAGYVANRDSDSISVLDLTDNSQATTIDVGTNPLSLTLYADGSLLYVANSGSRSVSIINTASFEVENTITVGYQPTSIVLSADETQAYVANFGQSGDIFTTASSITIIDTSLRAVAKELTISLYPFEALLHPAGEYIFITLAGSNGIEVIDLATDELL